jgi:hypothetical protein
MRRQTSAAIPSDTIGCNAPDRLFASVVSAREISEKNADFLATASPTIPCARMHIIHFARAVINDDPLIRLLRARAEKFPAGVSLAEIS